MTDPRSAAVYSRPEGHSVYGRLAVRCRLWPVLSQSPALLQPQLTLAATFDNPANGERRRAMEAQREGRKGPESLTRDSEN